jgi:hypothetical protein
MLNELVTRALISVWLFLVAVRFGVAPASPARAAPRRQTPIARQWRGVAAVGGRVVAYRVQLIVA